VKTHHVWSMGHSLNTSVYRQRTTLARGAGRSLWCRLPACFPPILALFAGACARMRIGERAVQHEQLEEWASRYAGGKPYEPFP